MTKKIDFIDTGKQELAAVRTASEDLIQLTKDTPAQFERASAIKNLIDQRITEIGQSTQLARNGNFTAAQEGISSEKSRLTMLSIQGRIGHFLSEERILESSRTQMVGQRLNQIRWLVLTSLPLIVLFISFMAVTIITGIRRPVTAMMNAMSDLGSGDRSARITQEMPSTEFQRLAQGYNAMADELETAVADLIDSKKHLHEANDLLNQNAEILQARGEVIELLGGMAHRMQAARTDEELTSIISVFAPRVLQNMPGVLYAHNNSRNLLVPVASWGNLSVSETGFPPDQCWALRRGRSHSVIENGSEIICCHVDKNLKTYHCEPLLAGGEVIGVLYLEGIVDQETRFRLTVVSENIALALVNHRLQRGLREQTIRDPLTSLFNRRYMEETLALEIARANRSNNPLSVVMCDVDHFKRFNDDYGHDAGDTILQAVAAEMRSRFRDGDVICRYGGEEFTIIAPGSTAETLAKRVEIVRKSISELILKQNGRTLGSMTMSFGIASWDPSMDRDGSSLIKAADEALYRAKHEGRDRIVINQRSIEPKTL